MVVSQIFVLLSLALKITMVYFLVVALRWMVQKPPKWPTAPPATRFAVLPAWFSRPKHRRNWKAVGLLPLFMASWLPLQVLSLFHKTTHWREIRHGTTQLDYA